MAEQAQEALRLSEAATPGPWFANPVAATAGQTIRASGNRPVARLLPDDRDSLGVPGAKGADRARGAIQRTEADAEFIARSRTLLPDLAQQLEQAERVIAGVRSKTALDVVADKMEAQDQLRKAEQRIEELERALETISRLTAPGASPQGLSRYIANDISQLVQETVVREDSDASA